ncbi:MAG: LIC_13355 family lipoprotein [Leptospiraceae bacterium]|nr:LIC_13355 family lipoprotein [Leptospiraceae bacterium]MDW8307175.1 LIC_13355 family lipoprotein [Leptospiraceae bacterium]
MKQNFLRPYGLFWLIVFSSCARLEEEAFREHPHTNTSTREENECRGSLNHGVSFYLANVVVEAPGHNCSAFCDQNKAVNGIRGSGFLNGSLDVFSLDNSSSSGACGGASSHLILRWAGKKIINGSGPDFIVYENGFYIGENPTNRFMDLLIVEVSNDKTRWCGFNPNYTHRPETIYSRDPQYWQRFAGKTPVNYNQEDSTRNYSIAELFQDNDHNGEGDLGGGDLFDLDALSDNNYWDTGCTASLRDELKTSGFIYLRLVPAARRINPDTGSFFVTDSMSNGPDIDGVLARYVENE